MNANIVNSIIGVWAAIRAEHEIFWAFHWRSKGTAYYGDHLLWQRLYEARVPEIDRLAEVIMAIGGVAAVDPLRSWLGVKDVIEKTVEASNLSDAERGAALVKETLARINAANNALGDSPYALAINNVLAGVADKQLEALYLIEQRKA
jgi:DNA-binding ferritin-like protein